MISEGEESGEDLQSLQLWTGQCVHLLKTLFLKSNVYPEKKHMQAFPYCQKDFLFLQEYDHLHERGNTLDVLRESKN